MQDLDVAEAHVLVPGGQAHVVQADARLAVLPAVELALARRAGAHREAATLDRQPEGAPAGGGHAWRVVDLRTRVGRSQLAVLASAAAGRQGIGCGACAAAAAQAGGRTRQQVSPSRSSLKQEFLWLPKMAV